MRQAGLACPKVQGKTFSASCTNSRPFGQAQTVVRGVSSSRRKLVPGHSKRLLRNLNPTIEARFFIRTHGRLSVKERLRLFVAQCEIRAHSRSGADYADWRAAGSFRKSSIQSGRHVQAAMQNPAIPAAMLQEPLGEQWLPKFGEAECSKHGSSSIRNGER